MINILYLDDSRIALKVMERDLKSYAKVTTAASIKEAEKAIKEQEFNAFILDYMLDDGTGIDFARFIRQIPKFETTPIVLISAGLTINIEYLAMRYGINKSLKKPVKSEELKKIINELLESPKIHAVERPHLNLSCIVGRQMAVIMNIRRMSIN